MADEPSTYVIETGPDRSTDKGRIDRGTTLKTASVGNVLYVGAVKATSDAYVQSTADLGTSLAELEAAKLVVKTKRNNVASKRTISDKLGDVAVTTVQNDVPAAADAEGLGWPLRKKLVSALVLAAPTKIELKYDPKLDLLRINVKWADGKAHPAEIQVADPNSQGQYARLIGNGAERVIKNPIAGSWSVQAATTNSSEQSDWFGPVVIVIVKK